MADWPAKRAAAFTVTFPIYDNDGDLDVYVTNVYSQNDNLYLNNGIVY